MVVVVRIIPRLKFPRRIFVSLNHFDVSHVFDHSRPLKTSIPKTKMCVPKTKT
ncbi:hypothetical protein B0H12DRAFT_1111716 [Mycena haematopus]|nr:hypothetical protein B0H12DRAFT_1161128 [Mycena haematopus]KAJ7256796.1 hypothetical protein B0H12DRAFT_1111716 [Mycena haematopus]